MRTTLGILGAGGAGAYARYALDNLVSRRLGGGYPWGILVVNVSGAFLVGLLTVLLQERGGLGPALRLSLTVGFLGAYTTFSTLALDSARLIERGSYLPAFLNLAGSLLLGLVAVFAGLAAGRALT